MARRLKLHEELCTLLGSRNVYFQPPESLKMQYPCIKYSVSGADQRHANDHSYRFTKRYEVIVLDHSPVSDIPGKIIEHFQMCSFDRAYAADNLNHYVYTIYY